MADFLVNTTKAGDQTQPTVTSLFGSEYMTVWSDEHDFTIKGQFLGLQGNKLGDEFTISTQPPEGPGIHPQWPSVLAAGFSGQFAVWLEAPLNIPGPHPCVKLQRFSDGHPAGPTVLVSEDVDPGIRPSLTLMFDGGVLVTWASPRREQRVRARRFTSEGTPATGELTLNTTEGRHGAPAATVLSDGNWVAAWSTDPVSIGGDRLTLRFFDLEAHAVTGEIQPNISGFTGVNGITLLDSGHFVVTSISSIQDSDLGEPQTTVVATVFKPDGTKTVDITAGSPKHFTRTSPAVSRLPSGRFLLTWVEQSADTHITVPTVMAKICSETEGSLGERVPVSSAAPGGRIDTCATTAFGNGPEGALIAWSDTSHLDGDTGSAVRGRTFNVVAPGMLV